MMWELQLKKPYVDEDNCEMGNSILIDDNDGAMLFIRLSEDGPEVVFRATEDDAFETLAQDSPAYILQLGEQTWYKIVDRFETFENLTINPSFTFHKVFGIINSTIVPNNSYGWRFGIDNAEIAIQKTFTDDADGKEMGDSIHIDNDGGLLIYIRVSKPDETPFLAVVFKETDDEEFVELTNKSPKKVIYFFNNI